MFKDDLFPPMDQAVEVVALFGLGGIVERPLQPAVVRTLVAPFVATAVVSIFIEKGYLTGGESIMIVLIAIYVLHEVSDSVGVVSQQGEVTPAQQKLTTHRR